MLSLSEHAAVRAGPRQQQADVQVSSRQPPALKPAGNRCGKWFWPSRLRLQVAMEWSLG